MDRDAIGDRMKEYESAGQTRLIRRLPVIIRVDGRAFHTLTRGMDKPVDWTFARLMWATATALCEEIQGARLAYVQSDEITVALLEPDAIKSEPWFGYERDKVVSLAASIATAAFNAERRIEHHTLRSVATFDARAFNLPAHEVVNNLIWRQQDATRNSILGLGLAHFSQKRLHGLNTSQIQDLLHAEKGINWNDCPVPQKRGACVVRQTYEEPGFQGVGLVKRARWVVDEAIPVFTQAREYIDSRMVTA